MKKLAMIFTLSTLTLGAYSVQADDDTHTTLHDKVHAMSAEDRDNFRQMMRDNMSKMTAEQRQSFKERMRGSKGDNKGCDKSHKHDKTSYKQQDQGRYHQAHHEVNTMPTMDRAAFANTMRNNIKRMSYQERQAFFDYMGLNKEQRHEVFERLGVKHHDHKHGRGCELK